MLTDARLRQKHISVWAQVMPETTAENLRIPCEFCQENRYSWLINGRTSGLTKCSTLYSCSNCLYLALSSLRWK